MKRRPVQKEPFKTACHGVLLFIAYDSKRRPFDAVVRELRHRSYDRGKPQEGLVEYEFEHGKEHGSMHREGGGNCLMHGGVVRLNQGCTFWAAKGVALVDDDGKPVTDPAARGCTRIPAPHGDPFELSLETETSYCGVCDDWYPDNNTCHHIYWVDGVGDCGPGEYDCREVPEGFKRVVRFAGCARSLRRDLTRRRSPSIYTMTPLIGTQSFDVTIGGREFGDRFHGLYDVDWPEGMVQEGCGWLRALDAKTKAANKLTLAWLREEIAAQDARRASGEAVYEVWMRGRYCGTEEQCTGKVAWSVAWQWVRDLRAAGAHGVFIRRRVPRASARRRAA